MLSCAGLQITAVKIVADVFGPDFVIDSFSYANTAGQGASLPVPRALRPASHSNADWAPCC